MTYPLERMMSNDVILRVTGDFYNDAQRKAYADNLAAKLNAGLAVPNAPLESTVMQED